MTHPHSVSVLLVSPHDWFASALEAVLAPEGFAFARVSSLRHALRHIEQAEPELVILGERLPEIDAPGLVRSLRSGGLSDGVPIVVYSPTFWHESDQAAAMAAGAWDILREPLRPAMIVARLRRLLEIRDLIHGMERDALVEHSSGQLTLAGLMRCVRPVQAAAERSGAPISCLVIGPTRPDVGSKLEAQRQLAADMCQASLRESDVWGWMGEADFGIVAFGSDAAGVTALVRRLNDRLSVDEEGSGLHPLSAGVVEFSQARSAENRGRGRGTNPAGMAAMSRLAAAHTALREARDVGGGIRIAEGS